MEFIRKNKALSFLTIIYAVGIFGLCFSSYGALFVKLTPLTLLLTFIILLYIGRVQVKDLIYLLIPFSLGMLTEVIGVKTGLLFGDYSYGEVLGLQIIGVPIMIGLNWMLLSYLCYTMAHDFVKNKQSSSLLIALLASAFMLILDLFLEPFAIKFGLWEWADGIPPLFNFITWFIVSFISIYALSRLKLSSENLFSKWVYLIMVVFFILSTLIRF